MRLWPDLWKTKRAAQLLAGQSFDKTKVPTSALNTNYGPDGSDRRVLSCVKCPGVDLPRLQARTALCILDRQHFESGSWNPRLTWKYIHTWEGLFSASKCLKSGLKYQEASFKFRKFGIWSFIQGLVSCQNLNLSRMIVLYENSFHKIEWSIVSIFNCFQKCLTLWCCSIQTTWRIKHQGVSVER